MEDLSFCGLHTSSGYLLALCGRLLSSEKLSKPLALCFLSLTPFSVPMSFLSSQSGLEGNLSSIMEKSVSRSSNLNFVPDVLLSEKN